jgi:hypothetical protein
MPFYEKGNVRIRYEEVGRGFPLLVTPGGGLNSGSHVADRRDQRRWKSSKTTSALSRWTSATPMAASPRAGADRKRLGCLCRHHSADGPSRHPEFFYMGYCIGGCSRQALAARADRVVAASSTRPSGIAAKIRRSCPAQHRQLAARFQERRPRSRRHDREVLSQLWRAQPDFLYSVPRDFIKNCHTPILVLPTTRRRTAADFDRCRLARPNSEITVFPWREPEELRQRIIQKCGPS